MKKLSVDEQIQFKREVIRRLYPDGTPHEGDDAFQSNAQEVALALAFMRAAAQQLCNNPKTAETAKEIGAFAAFHLLNSLELYSSHPFFDFVDGLRAEARSRPGPSPHDKFIHAMSIGAAAALQKAFGLTGQDARNLVAKELNKYPRYAATSGEAIRQWENRLTHEQFVKLAAASEEDFKRNYSHRSQKELIQSFVDQIDQLLRVPKSTE